MKKVTNELSKKKLRLGKKTILQLDQHAMIRLRGAGDTETCDVCGTRTCDTEDNCKTEKRLCELVTASCKIDLC